MKRERDDQIILAWHIEAFARQKKLSPLKQLLKRDEQPTGRVMTPDQIEATLRGWFGSFRKNR